MLRTTENLKRLVWPLVVLALALGCGASSGAETTDSRFFLSPFLGKYGFQNDQQLEQGNLLGTGLGYNLSDSWALEGLIGYIDSRKDSGTPDVNGTMYRLDALYNFQVRDRLVPYVAAGFGRLSLEPDNAARDDSSQWNLGGGLKYRITDRLLLRGDVRYLRSQNDLNNSSFTLGINYLFGGEPMPIPAHHAMPAEVR